MADTAQALLDVFSVVGEWLRIDALSLVPARRWERSYRPEASPGRLQRTIHGSYQKDATTRVRVTLKSDERRKQEWDEHVADLNYVPSPRWADEPPTAVAFQDYLGGRDWCVEGSVPPSVLDQLEADIGTGSVGHVAVWVKWALPDDDGTYYGTVYSVHWKTGAADHADKRSDARLRELVSKPLSDLSKTVGFGLILGFALLLIGDLRVILSGWGYAILAVGIGAVAVYLAWELERTAERQQRRVQRQLQRDE